MAARRGTKGRSFCRLGRRTEGTRRGKSERSSGAADCCLQCGTSSQWRTAFVALPVSPFRHALEGLFVDLAGDEEGEPTKGNWAIKDLKVRCLDVRRLRTDDRQAFEVARCTSCGYPFVVVDLSMAEVNLDQPSAWERPAAFLAFRPDNIDGDELKPARLNLCTGRLQQNAPNPEKPLWRTLYRVPGNTDDRDVPAVSSLRSGAFIGSCRHTPAYRPGCAGECAGRVTL